MAGLYLIGFAAPAFEAATCHVAETKNPVRNVPRAVLASACMAAVYFAFLPVIWLGALGPDPLGGDLGRPTYVDQDDPGPIRSRRMAVRPGRRSG